MIFERYSKDTLALAASSCLLLLPAKQNRGSEVRHSDYMYVENFVVARVYWAVVELANRRQGCLHVTSIWRLLMHSCSVWCSSQLHARLRLLRPAK